jgi:excisionase family DNA binding protein
VQEAITRKTRFEDLPDILSVDETRAYLGLGRSTMYELLRRKEVWAVRFGRAIRIPRVALEQYVYGARPGGQPERGDESARRQTAPAKGGRKCGSTSAVI